MMISKNENFIITFVYADTNWFLSDFNWTITEMDRVLICFSEFICFSQNGFNRIPIQHHEIGIIEIAKKVVEIKFPSVYL